MSERPGPAPSAEEPPPILGRWSRVYGLLVALLGLEALLMWMLRRWAE